MQLDERLRSHIDSLAAPVEIDEIFASTVNVASFDDQVVEMLLADSEVARNGHGRQIVLVAAAVALAITLGAALVVRSLAAEQLVTANAPGESLPILPSGLSDATWRKVAEPFPARNPENDVQVLDTTVVGGVAWAVGYEWRVDFANDRVEARKMGAIWRSTDGETWTPVDGEFGSLDIPVGNWAPSGIALEHIVGASDGTLLAFGNEFRTNISPVAYLSTDGGKSWDSLSLPTQGTSDSQLVSVSVDGARVVVLLIDDPATADATPRIISTSDNGQSWETIGQSFPSGSGYVADISVRGDRVTITGATRSADGGSSGIVQSVDGGETWKAASDFAHSAAVLREGPGGMVVVEVLENSDDTSYEVVEGSSFSTDFGNLWYRAESGEQTVVVGPQREDRAQVVRTQLVAHRNGVLAFVEAVSSSAVTVSITDIDTTTGDSNELGQLPSATFTDMFVLDGQVFVVGSERSAVLEMADEDASIWVAE